MDYNTWLNMMNFLLKEGMNRGYYIMDLAEMKIKYNGAEPNDFQVVKSIQPMHNFRPYKLPPEYSCISSGPIVIPYNAIKTNTI